MTGSGTPEVHVVFARHPTEPAAGRRRQLLDDAKTRGWQATSVSTDRYADGGGVVNVLHPWHAHLLYQRAHRAQVAVVVAGHVFVARNPGRTPTHANRVSLQRWLAYKAFVRPLASATVTTVVLDDFAAWQTTHGCDGPHDPRALPRMTFRSAHDDDNAPLGGSGARGFRTKHHHGPPPGKHHPVWRDDAGRNWLYDPSARHGTEELVVANQPMGVGMHWDVDVVSGAIVTTGKIWRPRRRRNGTYLNVYPDSGLRAGQGSNSDTFAHVWSVSAPSHRV